MSESTNVYSDGATNINVGQNLENMKDGYPYFNDYDINGLGDDASVSS